MAGASVVAGVAVSVCVNLMTDQWSFSLIGATAACALVWATLEFLRSRDEGGAQQIAVRVRATNGGRIADSPTHVAAAASRSTVDRSAEGGTIEASAVRVSRDAQVTQHASGGGTVSDSDITVQ
ncbi:MULTISPECIES: hypothetical protein [Streptomyces]|uniref:hypothetical protein n=1 Tax=Streptomyces TaxID=1883 RepID=UPI000F96877F|nr:hypothetical protein [Streptomyces sp. WAC08452]MDV6288408.1 hypothetical protein [Streptomyces sp. UP1A-1]RSS27690.1 hypothetical protein EF916_19910 [Streptomyces sp. WAC08452]